jgi:hypothetical protein
MKGEMNRKRRCTRFADKNNCKARKDKKNNKQK